MNIVLKGVRVKKDVLRVNAGFQLTLYERGASFANYAGWLYLNHCAQEISAWEDILRVQPATLAAILSYSSGESN